MTVFHEAEFFVWGVDYPFQKTYGMFRILTSLFEGRDGTPCRPLLCLAGTRIHVPKGIPRGARIRTIGDDSVLMSRHDQVSHGGEGGREPSNGQRQQASAGLPR